MKVLGLTGNIGTGKSTVAKMFARQGAAVFDADKKVHEFLLPEGKAYKKIAKQFSESLQGKKLCHQKLGEIIFKDPKKRKKLEDILHPLVWQERDAFVKKAKRSGVKAVILEIPLLFETGEEKKCDATICVTASALTQKQRVLRRKNMTAQKLKRIKNAQWPEREKKKKADFIISTDKSKKEVYKNVKTIWQTLIQEE